MKQVLTFKSIRSRIFAGFIIVIALVIGLTLVNIISINKINNNTDHIVNENLNLLIYNQNLSSTVKNGIAAARGFYLTKDEQYIEDFEAQFSLNEELSKEAIENGMSEEGKKLADKSQEWFEIAANQIIPAYSRGDVEEARRLLAETDPLVNEIVTGFEDATQKREDLINSDGKAIIDLGESTATISIIASILVILFAVLSAIFTSRAITKPIKVVMERMGSMAAGDLSQQPIRTNSRDEVGKLVDSTNQMSDKVRELLQQISDVSETVSAQSEELTQSENEVRVGSIQVATTMQEMASGSEAQASHTTDLTSTMTEFAAKISELNMNGEQIQQSSNQVISLAVTGSELMDGSSSQMAKIDGIVQEAVLKVKNLDSKSKEISTLVEVIKAIADQTNLLALNAAIEAARAGEHGRGFAVVADEVRKLAEQVAVSVTEITGIVKGIQEETNNVTDSLESGYREVEQGTEKIEETSTTFKNIDKALNNMAQDIQEVLETLAMISKDSQSMNTKIEEIAAISEEAAAGVEQTSASSQQTSSSMEEVAKSSDDLAKLAEKMNLLVRQFKLK
ncbi:methyl-accepting chemotaxis protein [Metabacillus sediminilitoris]|uniref:Methyl-accepting chemotaxis protein n=1 Tax=Metabacillus sediminilitoris TaxID=2567941 RepID=A0A4S4C057_9BACI|nr:methyl-accepting chemotaxis protein [Metabacillus sediminilitoris]QGQ47928.1 HAMP domain-containing protein [Metabacillus sediminilitoris]THF80958.1 methyl-accepting chemotaxis protein [Metabacillus sediminilitoris]